jgi:4-carboxymuconolactone decarboxylase
MSGYDLDKRDADTSGNPRITPMAPEDFSDEAAALVKETFKHVPQVDMANVPEYFAIAFRHAPLARLNMELGIALGANGLLPPRERELATLRVGWLAGAPFEWGEHVPAAKRHGVTDEEIERLTIGSDADGWSEHDRAVIRATEELMRGYAISDETWAVLAKSWTEQQLMELPGLVGHYAMTAMMQNAVRFNLLDGNVGLRRR